MAKLRNILLMGIFSYIVLIGYPNSYMAHSPSACNSGSESIGWRLHCTNSSNGHIGIASLTYKYSPNLSSSYKDYTSTGATRWNLTGIVNISESSNSQNVIFQYNDPNVSTRAYVRSYTFGNHKSRWDINYNHAKMKDSAPSTNNGTATHEFGHTIGLVDLTSSSNTNKLMYGTTARTVNFPQFADMEGAREGIK